MNYYQARKSELTGKWKYTKARDKMVFEVGYCSNVQMCPDCKGKSYGYGELSHEKRIELGFVPCETCGNTGTIALEEDEQCPGHDTAEGADKHFYDYVMDHLKYNKMDNERVQYKCSYKDDVLSLCPNWATTIIETGQYMHANAYLCDIHANRTDFMKLHPFGSPITICSSY